jgi:hypothetical protein
MLLLGRKTQENYKFFLSLKLGIEVSQKLGML